MLYPWTNASREQIPDGLTFYALDDQTTVRLRTERTVPVPPVQAALLSHHLRRVLRANGLDTTPPYRPKET